jgi:hypothetical protein
MSTTRIINGIEYTIPPGTEHVWTPPEQVVVTPAPDEISISNYLENLGAQACVRLQSPEVINDLITNIKDIWARFTNKSITSLQLSEELAEFRLSKLSTGDGFDDITVQQFEDVMVKMMKESTSG